MKLTAAELLPYIAPDVRAKPAEEFHRETDDDIDFAGR